MTIVKRDNKVEIRSHKTGKKLGDFGSVTEARKRLKQIEYFTRLRSKKK